MSNKTIKIQIIADHQDYKKGQIVELEDSLAINFLTNGKALKIHRKKDEVAEDKTTEKESKKSKKNDQ
jgi:galactokinase